jgi:menaquinone-dependent protoporphyrinogen oxidase
VDKEGHDLLESMRPKEFDELQAMLTPQGEKVFFGSWDPEDPPKGLTEHIMDILPAGREAMPVGDFRDWGAVDSWAEQIAARLKDSAA